MAFLLPVLLVIILFAVVATLFRNGLWSNTIALFNVILATLLASNLFEPAASRLTAMAPGGAYLWDFVALWVLFGLFYSLLRAVTDYISRTRVHFHSLLDLPLSAVVAVWIGWIMICFTTMTLHTAPLGRNFLGGGFQPEAHMLLGLAPDRVWLGFLQSVSRGGMGRGSDEKKPEQHVFDPRGEFMVKYATRRARFEKTEGLFSGAK